MLSAPDAAWALAVERAAVIGRLVEADRVSVEAADVATAELGISRRRVYALVQRWREGSGLVSDLLVGRSGGGRGGGRSPEAVETVMRETLRSRYLSRQRRSLSAVHREIARLCKARGLPVPSRGARCGGWRGWIRCRRWPRVRGVTRRGRCSRLVGGAGGRQAVGAGADGSHGGRRGGGL